MELVVGHEISVTASSAPGDTSRRHLPYESADSYGPTEVTDGGYYLAELTLERRLVRATGRYEYPITRAHGLAYGTRRHGTTASCTH